MATWYTKNRQKREVRQQKLATTESKPAVSARLQPSWAQLRSWMELADELQLTWVESVGSFEFEEEEASCNAAAPIQATVEFKQPVLAPIGGTRIDAQFIAINRTVPLAAVPSAPVKPAPSPDKDPMRHLEQMSMGSLFRLSSSQLAVGA